MPDFGLGKALGKAVREGASKAKVLRPGEAEAAAADAAKAAAKNAPDAAAPKVEPTLAPDAAAPAAEPAIQPDTAPVAAPTTAPDATLAPVQPMVKKVPVQTPEEAAVGAAVEPPGATPMPAQVVEKVPPVTLTGNALDAEANRISKAQLGDYSLDETHQPNFDQMRLTDDIKATIADLAQQNASRIDEARRGVITHEQLQGLASDLDVGEDVVMQIMQRENGGVLNAETILAARQVLGSSAERVKTLADKISSGQATDIDKVTFARQIQFHNEYTTQFMGARAEAGRALNAFGIPTGGLEAVPAARLAEIISNAGGDIERLAKAVSMADNVTAITKVATPGIWTRSGQAATNLVNRIFVNGILSGPTTHGVNMMGNALFQAMNQAEMAAASRVGYFLGSEDRIAAGEALSNLHGMLGATRDAWRLAARTVRTGETIDGVLKIEGRTNAPNLADLTDQPLLRRLLHITDSVIDAPTKRGLAAEDELFKTMAYRASLEQQAFQHVQAKLQAGEITMADAAQAAKDFMEGAPEEAQQAAQDWAEKVTFQSPLGPIGSSFQKWLRSIPVLTLIAPFVRTPTNIFKESAARSPMALFTGRFYKDIAAGGRQRDLALTRFAMGSMTAAMVANWTANGDITGAGPSNPDAKMLWEANGRRPYSVRVANPVTHEVTWHSYARLEPAASVIGAVADTTEILAYLDDGEVENLTDDQQRAYNAAGAVIAGIMNNTGNKTFLQGIANFTDMVSNPQQEIKGYLNQMVPSLVPFSGLQRTARNISDPYLREAWTINDKLRDNTPGLSEKLPARLGLFGESREKNSGSLLGVMSPIPESPQKYDGVYRELNDVMEKTRVVPLTMPDKKFEGLRLTADEYTKLVKVARTEPLFDGGTTTLHDKLEQVMLSDTYQALPPLGKADMLKTYQNQADSAARRLMVDQESSPYFDPTLADRVTARRQKKSQMTGKAVE